jgi:hypothetical protein
VARQRIFHLRQHVEGSGDVADDIAIDESQAISIKSAQAHV